MKMKLLVSLLLLPVLAAAWLTLQEKPSRALALDQVVAVELVDKESSAEGDADDDTLFVAADGAEVDADGEEVDTNTDEIMPEADDAENQEI